MRNFILFSFIALAQSRPGYDYSIRGGQEHGGGLQGGGHGIALTSGSGGSGYESGYAIAGHGGSVGISGHGGSVGISGPGGSVGISGPGEAAVGGSILQTSGSLGSISQGLQSVHKHVYVHVPPRGFEDEQLQPRIHAQLSKPQKHYKIIFIKAPAAPTYQQPIIPLAPQNEEKTLIYVLAKRPEEPADIVIPSPPATPPSKPEVYFIKYQARREGGGIGAGGGIGIGGGAGAGVGLGIGAGVGTGVGIGSGAVGGLGGGIIVGGGVGVGGVGVGGGADIEGDGHGGNIQEHVIEGHGESGPGIDVRGVEGAGGHHGVAVVPSGSYGPPGYGKSSH